MGEEGGPAGSGEDRRVRGNIILTEVTAGAIALHPQANLLTLEVDVETHPHKGMQSSITPLLFPGAPKVDIDAATFVNSLNDSGFEGRR